ncbi:MAG: hypothetical protein IKX83_05850 [Clostridia bacterium]|nr:hypothetical protein [Clostridia bacterium]
METTPSTSTGYRYEKAFTNALEKFPTLEQISTVGTFGIPGLAHTRVAEGLCECMTPQGICVAGPYVLITAYCNIRKYREELEKHPGKGDNPAKLEAARQHEQHKSVIYVVDKETLAHIATVALPDCNHVGGITYDGTYVWIAKDTDLKMSAVLFSELQRVIDYKQGSVRYLTTDRCRCNAVFTTTFRDRIWVGDSYSKKPGTLVCFRVKSIFGVPHIKREGGIELPILAQGAILADIGDKTVLAISVSGGRVNPSVVHRYEVDLSNVRPGTVLKLSDCKDLGALELPPMMEEIALDPETNNVYAQFESASSPYSAVAGNPCKAIVDRVCVSTLEDWFPELMYYGKEASE